MSDAPEHEHRLKAAMLHELKHSDKKKKHIASQKRPLLLLSIVIGVLLVAFLAWYISQLSYDYRISNGSVTITRYKGKEADVLIPSRILWFPVTEIGERAFWERADITSVILPEGITHIGDYAFGMCTGLREATLPDSLIEVAPGSFFNCAALLHIFIPDNVRIIGEKAFAGAGLTKIVIPDSVEAIGVSAFANCTALVSVTLGEGLTAIAVGTFSGCSSLRGVIIPDGVTEIGNRAFSNTGIRYVTISNSVTYIGVGAFEFCAGLESVLIPASVVEIGVGAFWGGVNLRGAFFEGNAPRIRHDVSSFNNAAPFTVFYRAGTTGWSNSWNGYPTKEY